MADRPPSGFWGRIRGMARWLKRLLTWIGEVVAALILVMVSIFVADMLGWESRGARRALAGSIVLFMVLALVVGSELPALRRRLRDGKPPRPRHKRKFPL
jgi:uncharacterized membrane protein YhaH (DUF805 family)